MQEPVALPPSRINDDLLRFVMRQRAPRWFWITVLVLGGLLLAALAAVGLLILDGLQFLGLTDTVYWAIFISNFVYFVGISHAGVMISAILRLTQAEWRRPITRSAEVLAIFSLITAGLFPIIHTGRLWRTAYWIFPYDFNRDLWPDVRSALIWDPSAIVTYLTATILFVFVDLLPDVAVARDRASGWRKRIYAGLALGFRGTARQWRIQTVAGQLLSALILAVFVSVHSIVAWDFAMAIQPGWHTTALAPYFVVGAVHSGVAAVVTTMVVLRRALRLERYITLQHFDTIGRLQLVVAPVYLFFFLTDFYFGIFARDPNELQIWQLRLFEPPTNILFYVQVTTTLLIPVPFWLFARFRRSIKAMFWTSISVNIGMWLERYVLVVTPLQLKQPFTFEWIPAYVPSVVETLVTAASFGLLAFGVLVFAKLLPIVPLWDVREGEALATTVRVGAAEVPAAMREE
jgi:molybdopterin-containing oxidoreductase family membrane subunit